ncbi:MAG TPA: histidine kinase [Vicinamibacterales bacterium]|nr:histidine kinase [Vicinamibacterales bacterium]
MHPILDDRRWLVLHLVAWAVTGEVIALLVQALFGAPWLGSMIFGVPAGLVGGLISLSAWYVSRATSPSWTDRLRPILSWLAGAVFGGLLWALLAQVWWQGLERAGLVAIDETQRSALFALLKGLGILGYLLAVAAYRALHAFEESAAATRRALQSEVAQRDAELRALRAQLDPHFLFNSLNSIAGLTSGNPAKAREMCQLLADFFRQSLTVGQVARIPLSQEIALAEQYLRVEQVRFGSRLALSLDVAPETTTVPVPPLLLQPLVENAVRHGIATLLDGGTIAIDTRLGRGHVVIAVSNPRDPDARRRGTGLGLDIVTRRLAATFGDRASLTVEPSAEAYRAQITVPMEETS